MNFYLDQVGWPVSGLWSAPTRSPILRETFVRGSTPRIAVRFVAAGVVQELGNTATIGFALKASRQASGWLTVPVLATKIGTGTDTVYTLAPTISSTALDTWLAGADSAAALAILYWSDAGTGGTAGGFGMGEIQLSARIYQNANTGGEVIPGVVTSSTAQVLNGIVHFTGTDATSLPYVPTVSLTAGSGVPFLIRVNGQFIPVYLDAGAADATDPGQVAPLDYDAGTNAKHWTRGL